MWLNFGFDPFRVGSAQVVFGLEIEPEFSGILEEAGESERSIGRDATPSLDDVGYPAVRNFQRLREGVILTLVRRITHLCLTRSFSARIISAGTERSGG